MGNFVLTVFCFIVICLINLNSYGNAFTNNLTTNCTTLRNIFANASAQFTLCSIENARPITLCENCVDAYIDLLGSFDNMSKVSFNDSTCLDEFVNLDRLQIVYYLYESNVNLWTRAKCYECYMIENGKQSRVVSNETKEFKSRYDKFISCTNETDKADLCPKCMDDYTDLNNYYTSISDINEKIGLCMDLVDTMNNTWIYWSTNCCKYRRHNEYIFIGSSIVVFLITVFFYLITRFCEEKKAPTILQQSRFAASINNLRS